MSAPIHYTLQMLQERNLDLERQITQSRSKIKSHWDNIFDVPKANTKSERLMANVERGFAIYDGFMTAYKLLRWMRVASQLFKKKRK